MSLQVMFISRHGSKNLGYEGDEFPNVLESFLQHLHHDDASATWAAIEGHLNDDIPYDATFRLRTKSGNWCWFRSKGRAIRSSDGTARRMAGSISDITELKAIQEQLSYDALHDQLTGLPNRTLLRDRLEQTLLKQNRTNNSYSLMFIDFDRFKFVNDSFGHETGDELLRQIAHRLRECLRSVDSVCANPKGKLSARMGGDEFVVLLEEMARPEDALLVADRLLFSLNQPYQLGDHELKSTASIGIVLGDPTYCSADEVLRDADIAMYEAKRRGKARYVVFGDSMQSSANHVLEATTKEPSA